MPRTTRKPTDCVTPTTNAKSAVVSQVARIIKRERLDYAAFLYVCQRVRRKLGLKKPHAERTLPKVLSGDELSRFFRVIQDCGDTQHEIMLKLLFYTAVRVGELVAIERGDVDLANAKIFIRQGKGAKDRYILFPRAFALVLKTHLKATAKNRYLFETERRGPYTARRVQQIVAGYKTQAGIAGKVHPHLFRHQMITYLTSKGLSDAQIQLISGHASKKSLEVYQHISLASTAAAYQEAVASLGI